MPAVVPRRVAQAALAASRSPSSLAKASPRGNVDPRFETPLALVVGVAVSLLVLAMMYRAEAYEHGVVIESCSRPILELLGVLWSLAVVTHVCSRGGIDLVRVFGGHAPDARQGPSVPLVDDMYILAVGSTFAYLALSVLVQLVRDFSPEAIEWKTYSFACFVVAAVVLGSSRACLPLGAHRAAVARSLGRCMCAGLFPVQFGDVLAGDYLTSLSKGFGDLVICQCVWVVSGPADWGCVVSFLTPMACAVPFVSRLVQCLRAFRDTRQQRHLANAFKYALGMGVALLSNLKRRGFPHAVPLYYAVVASNSLFSFYWDVTMDWGMWERDASGAWARRVSPTFPRWMFTGAAVVDLMLRVQWSLKLVSVGPSNAHEAVILAVGLELFRRTLWACLRIEFEAHVQRLRGEQTGDLEAN